MNPIVRLSGAICHPTRAAGTVVRSTVGASVNVASAGFRLTSHAVGWAAERVIGTAVEPRVPGESDRNPSVDSVLEVAVPVAAPDVTPAATTSTPQAPETKTAAKKTPAKKAPVKKAPSGKAPAKKAPSKKAPAKKAPSKKAAVLAPALGLSEAEVQDGLDDTPPEPLIDPATAKSVASESAVLQQAADPDKG